MDTINTAASRAIVLCLSGARIDDIRILPAMHPLLQQGALAELEPAPIVSPLAQRFQALGGRLPASFGFFDTLVPQNYTVVAETAGRGGAPRLLPDLLRAVGWSVDEREASLASLPAVLAEWAEEQMSASLQRCLFLSCPVATSFDVSPLAEAVGLARAWLGESGLLALLSETQAAPVRKFVNLNNFLADMGVLERDASSGEIRWEDSLAYFAGYGQLWINLRGRDARGAVYPQDEYEEVRDSLIAALPAKLRDGAETVIERVYRKEEFYSGSEYLFCLPDLVVVFKPGYVPSPASARLAFDPAPLIAPASGATADTGISPSTARGFLLVSGPGLQAGAALPDPAPLIAAAPTLLHALGVEYVDMEGMALGDLFTPAYLAAHPVRDGLQSQELSEEDEERIISHLRDLGYV